jgi:hypothetical protein
MLPVAERSRFLALLGASSSRAALEETAFEEASIAAMLRRHFGADAA